MQKKIVSWPTRARYSSALPYNPESGKPHVDFGWQDELQEAAYVSSVGNQYSNLQVAVPVQVLADGRVVPCQPRESQPLLSTSSPHSTPAQQLNVIDTLKPTDKLLKTVTFREAQNRAISCRSQGRYDDAIGWTNITKVRGRQMPLDKGQQASMYRLRGQLYYEKANTIKFPEQKRKTLEESIKAFGKNPNDPVSLRNKANMQMVLANVEASQGNNKEAVKYYELALASAELALKKRGQNNAYVENYALAQVNQAYARFLACGQDNRGGRQQQTMAVKIRTLTKNKEAHFFNFCVKWKALRQSLGERPYAVQYLRANVELAEASAKRQELASAMNYLIEAQKMATTLNATQVARRGPVSTATKALSDADKQRFVLEVTWGVVQIKKAVQMNVSREEHFLTQHQFNGRAWSLFVGADKVADKRQEVRAALAAAKEPKTAHARGVTRPSQFGYAGQLGYQGLGLSTLQNHPYLAVGRGHSNGLAPRGSQPQYNVSVHQPSTSSRGSHTHTAPQWHARLVDPTTSS